MSAIQPLDQTPGPAQKIRAILDRQRASFLDEGPPTAQLRIDRINRAIDLLVRHDKAFCEAMSEDFSHRSIHQSRITDIYGSVEPLKHARKHVRQWMKSERRPVMFPLNMAGAKATVQYQPLGVVGAISPWNFPIYLTFSPLAGIFAAGNRLMLKPSEFTPATSALLAELFGKAYDETEVAIITGGPDVGAAFSSMPFDHLLFTGSTSVGRHVMRAAAENLVPVTLELGGKSPTVVGKGVDMTQVTARIANAKLLNAGQICLAPDYALVPKARLEEFVVGITGAVEQHYPTLVDNDDYTAIINERHRDRLLGYLVDAETKGGRLIEVNPSNEEFGKDGNRKLPLTMVLDPTDEMRVMQDEIFGPILPVKTYDSIDEVIAYVNDHARPLALYYFGDDDAEQRRVLKRTTSGGVTINDCLMHVSCEDIPFGGVGPSGMGAYHGHEGFKNFSHARGVFKQARLDLMGVMRPPYGEKLEKALRFLIKG